MEENTNIVETVETGDSYDTFESYETENAETTETSAETTENMGIEAESNSPKGEKSTRFADYRRREELEQYRTEANNLKAKSSEYEQKIAEYEERERRLNELLGNYYDGDSIADKMLSIEAQVRGVSIADLKAEREHNEAVQQAERQRDEELAYYKSIAEQVQREKAQAMYDADLKAVQALDSQVKSLEDLGDDFTRLRFTINPLTGEYYSVADVYNHIKSKIKPLPQTSGTVNTTAEESKETDFMSMSNDAFNEIFNKVVYGG